MRMSYEEIEQCVINAKNGSKDDMLKIFLEFEGFIIKEAKKYYIKNHEISDLLQITYISIDNAVKKYTTGNKAFKTYAYITIVNSLKATLRKSEKQNLEYSLNTPLNDTEENSSEYIDTIEAEVNIEELIVSSERSKAIQGALGKLNKTDVELVKDLYFKNSTLRSYAEKKNIHYSKAQRERKRVIKQLTNTLGGRDGFQYMN